MLYVDGVNVDGVGVVVVEGSVVDYVVGCVVDGDVDQCRGDDDVWYDGVGIVSVTGGMMMYDMSMLILPVRFALLVVSFALITVLILCCVRDVGVGDCDGISICVVIIVGLVVYI